MEDDKIQKMILLDPAQLRAELEAMSMEELRAMALAVSKQLQIKK